MTTTDDLRAQLAALKDLVTKAKAMPMSASCVVNRGEAIALIDAAVAAIPESTAMTPREMASSQMIDAAREQAAALISQENIVKEAKIEAERVRRDAQTEAEGLRTETDAFVDSRMASFESVLHKTLSQVQLARTRLSQRSGLDVDEEPSGE